jgi:hypothetical protein
VRVQAPVGVSTGRGIPDNDLLRREKKIRRYEGDVLDAARLEFARAGLRQDSYRSTLGAVNGEKKVVGEQAASAKAV